MRKGIGNYQKFGHKFFHGVQLLLDRLERIHPYVLPSTHRQKSKRGSVNWNSYYYSRFRPIGKSWGKRDLKFYRRWYYMWIIFINTIVPLYKKQKTSFEIGSGIGATASLLKEHEVNIMGSDISEEMVSIAKKLVPDVPFMHFDANNNTLGKNLFDYVYAFEVIEHIAHPSKAIQTIYSLLKKDGLFIGSCPYPYIKNYEDVTHRSMFPPKKWEKLFQKQGFHSVRTVPMTFIPFFWRLSKYFNIPLPFYTTFSRCVSTILIIARK